MNDDDENPQYYSGMIRKVENHNQQQQQQPTTQLGCVGMIIAVAILFGLFRLWKWMVVLLLISE